MPVVSIVLPVYNGEKYLAQSIESCLAQTFTDWELIIVDDCSKDTTPQIIQTYAARDQRIKPYRNQQNKKLPGSLNEGFRHAVGQYLTWTSDDNLYRPLALQTMVTYLVQNPQIDLVYTDFSRITETGAFKDLMKIHEPEDILVDTIGACFLYKRAVHDKLGGYAEDLFLAEDYDFFIRAYNNFKFAHLPQDLYQYRAHDQRLSATREMERYGVFERMFKRYIGLGYFPKRFDRMRLYLKLYYCLNPQGKTQEARQYLFKALSAAPLPFLFYMARRLLIKAQDRLKL